MNAAVRAVLLVACTLTAIVIALSFGLRSGDVSPSHNNNNNGSKPRNEDISNEQLEWRGGGITGPSEVEALNRLQSLYHETFFRTGVSNVCSWSRGELVRVLLNVTRILAAEGMEDASNDCRVTLPGHLRAVCLLTAAMHATSAQQRFTDVPAFHRSYCAAWVSCIEWTRGRFNLALTSERLREVYKREVLPMVTDSDSGGPNLRQFDALQSQFLHGLVGEAVAASRGGPGSSVKAEGTTNGQRVKVNLIEVEWMWRRALVHDAHQKKITNIFNVHEYARSAGKTKLAPEPLSSTSLEPTELNAAFQGKADFAFVEDDQDMKLMAADRNEGGSGGGSQQQQRPLAYLSSLQVVATLHHILHGAEESDDDDSGAPLIPIVVFYGDSTNREIFYALIQTIRRGFEVAAMKGRGYFHPNIQHRMNYDVVYRLFETHDELVLFDSPTTRHDGHATIESFLREMAQIAKAHKEKGGSAKSLLLPLVVMVWLWDPWTFRPRRIMDMSTIESPDDSYCRGIKPNAAKTSYCQRNLLEVGSVRIPLAVQGTSFWEHRLGPPLLRSFSFPTRHLNTSSHFRHRGSLYVLTSFAHNHLQPLTRLFSPPVTLSRASKSPLQSSNTDDEETKGNAGNSSLHLAGRCNSSLFLFDVRAANRVYDDMHKPPEAQRSEDEMRQEMDRVELAPPSVLSTNGQHYLSKKCTNRQIGRNVNLFRWINGTVMRRGRPPTPVTLSPWSTIALLDKSKAQLLLHRFPLGDERHFSCHAKSAKFGRSDLQRFSFDASLTADAVLSVITPFFSFRPNTSDIPVTVPLSFSEDAAKLKRVSGKIVAGQHPSLYRTAADARLPADCVPQFLSAMMQRNEAKKGLSLKDLAAFLARDVFQAQRNDFLLAENYKAYQRKRVIEVGLEHRVPLYEPLSTVGGIVTPPLRAGENSRLNQHDGEKDVSSLLHHHYVLQGTDESGIASTIVVYPYGDLKNAITIGVNGEEALCRDSGNLMLVQLMLQDMIVKG